MKKFCLSLTLCLLISAPLAAAQDDASSKVKYGKTDLKSVSDMLFRKGILRADDPVAVEEYIRIHECGLYEQYASDDFAWNRIRESYARELQVSVGGFPDGVEIESAIRLGQYDLTNGEFTVDREYAMERTGIISIVDISSGSYDPCYEQRFQGFVPRVHPLTLKIKTDIPITLQGIPMNRKEADALIADMNKRPGNPDEKRMVTMVLRIRVTTVDPLSGMTDPLRRTILGLVDEMRVYDGPERQKLLFKRDYQTQREKTSKK